MASVGTSSKLARVGFRRPWISFFGLGGLVVLGLGALEPELFDGVRTFFVAPSRTRYPVRGIDISHHQGPIDWLKVKASGQAFAFIKATEGADFRDTRFAENWQLARSHGLMTGAYHFFTFCSPGLAQAENFLAVAPHDAPTLPLSVDVEFTGNCVGWESIESIQRELLSFLAHVQARVGRPPLLYTTEEVRRELVPAELRAHPYWLRSLWGEPSDAGPWQFWQYSDSGSVPGIDGEVDLNVFAGSPAAWDALVGGAAAP